jgi:hypothetical protein
VTVHQNFDELGFPKDHPGRSKTDSYYVNAEHMLRTHTSAHEVESYRSDKNAFLIAADVYRRDEIDSSHYPVFHQMEGMRIWDQGDLSELKAENARLAAELAKSPLQVEDDTVVGPSNPTRRSTTPSTRRRLRRTSSTVSTGSFSSCSATSPRPRASRSVSAGSRPRSPGHRRASRSRCGSTTTGSRSSAAVS